MALNLTALAQAPATQSGAGLRVAKAHEVVVDSAKFKADSLARLARARQVDSLRTQSSIANRMKFRANDSISLDLDTLQVMRLYGQGKLDHEGRKLDAERIAVMIDSGLVRARGVPDSTGENFKGEPVFNEGGQKFDTHAIAYNFKTRKGTINYTRTQQGESYVIAAKSKRMPDGAFFNYSNKFTTCSDDHPHFYLRANRIKFLPNNRVVTGPFYIAMADIPLPFLIPFGFFPASSKRSSGVIFPAFGEDPNRGFNLRNGGYYFVINDHWDATVTGDIYARGSYRVQTLVNYSKRYRYDGGFSYQYASNQFGQEGDPDYREESNWFLSWRHNQTLTPNTRFNADVNAGASNFLRQNTFQLASVVTNQLQSSIAVQTSLPRAGWNFAISANHSQNTQSRQVTLSAPNIQITKADRVYPFRWRELTGTPRWYENIALTYNAAIRSTVTVSERNFGTPAMWDSLRYGMQHNAQLNTNFSVLRFFTVTPAVNYTEWWYPSSREATTTDLRGGAFRGPTSFGADTLLTESDAFGGITGMVFTYRPGFTTARQFNVSLNVNTRIYGLKQFSGLRRMALRHIMIPSFGFSYQPDFGSGRWGFYQPRFINREETQVQRFSRFDGQRFVFGGPGQGLQSSLNFRLQNMVELKYLSKKNAEDKDDSKPTFTYLRLLDDLSLGASYNLAADSFRLSTIPITARTSIFKNMIAIQANAVIDPYAYVPTARGGARRINVYEFARSRSLGTLTSADVSIGLNLSPRGSSEAQAKKAKTLAKRTEAGGETEAAGLSETDPADADEDELTPLERFRRLYVDFDLKWNLTVSYTWQQSSVPGQPVQTIQSLNFSGGVELTRKWRIQLNSGYDFLRREISFTTFSVMRDLHCWELSFSGSPFGQFRSYFLEIRVKASMLQDLRVQKRRDWQDIQLAPVNLISR